MHVCFSFEKQYYAIFWTMDKIGSPLPWAMPMNNFVWYERWLNEVSCNQSMFKRLKTNVIVEVGLKLGRKLCYHAVMLFQFDR